MIALPFYFDRSTRAMGVTRSIASFAIAAVLVAACTSNTEGDNASPTTDPEPDVEVTVTVPDDSPVETDENAGDPPGEAEQDSIYPPSPLASVSAELDGALLGISTGLTRAERGPRFEFLEEAAGRQFDIGHVFHAWDDAIPTDDDLMHLEDGRILMISWNGTDTIEIQNGDHDEWIRTQAESVRDLEQPVMLRWLWEMDANRRRAWVHSGEDFVGAWNHIRAIFNEVGADNAQFVWCPNEFLFWDDGDPTPWYPGDENVDWLCADGYNWPDSVDHPEWIEMDEIFGDFIAWAEPRGLPIVIGETGSNEALDDPQAKADWLRGLPTLLEESLPAIDAVVYFDKDFRFNDHPDWRLDTSAPSFDAWNEIANDPYFNPLAAAAE